MAPCRGRRHPPAGRARDEPDADQEGLDDRLDGLRLLAHRDGERVQADRASAEPREDDLHHGPVGLNTLAVSVGEEAETIEAVVEPFLVRIGLITRTPRGRVATPAAWRHFGLSESAPEGAATLPIDDL